MLAFSGHTRSISIINCQWKFNLPLHVLRFISFISFPLRHRFVVICIIIIACLASLVNCLGDLTVDGHVWWGIKLPAFKFATLMFFRLINTYTGRCRILPLLNKLNYISLDVIWRINLQLLFRCRMTKLRVFVFVKCAWFGLVKVVTGATGIFSVFQRVQFH